MFKPVKLLGEVMALAYLVNANTDHCVFVNYLGHIDQIEIHIFPNKDKYQSIHCVYEGDVYLDGRRKTDTEKRLLEIKSTLEGYLYPRLEGINYES